MPSMNLPLPAMTKTSHCFCENNSTAVTLRPVTTDRTARPLNFLGLFLIAQSTLMYEILLTRIFSVTMWYHFAFVAVSIAMFGMTAGAAIVFVLPQCFKVEQTRRSLAISSLLFGVLIPISFVLHLWIPFNPSASGAAEILML